ncbi:CcmD family protein [Sphingobacterium oryzagri]|uniref:CcmD family protein n=1 Tax=Sphingobacterium oryzagri TaxID=3025669 RepID=A0ABY7WI18_9SPHI|nr:CcmD family protein [Sphingobacterium sp. KACC 22765]WDF68229.1 CcmD family protein [Sphingobacterium sp. KACC 22765]
MKNIIAVVFFLLSSVSLFAQSEIDMATGLRSSGKIYVVVLVLLTIFAVLGVFLFLLDRRIKKLEK